MGSWLGMCSVGLFVWLRGVLLVLLWLIAVVGVGSEVMVGVGGDWGMRAC